jgi:hypothetical protein
MDNTITVRVANNYGTRAIYPVCNNATVFATIAGTRTLTDHTLKLIKALGYTVNVQQEAL